MFAVKTNSQGKFELGKAQVINTYDPAYRARTKHINIEYHWIRERIALHDASLTYVKSEEDLADLSFAVCTTFYYSSKARHGLDSRSLRVPCALRGSVRITHVHYITAIIAE